ncbi:tripartite tricarboxylate transporter substrate binding protein [Alcaligenaceae bacterium]|nr:tripartite tricarboxylate transporter substrate binding protein [Alcaligenaceae bacterium]
MLKVSICMLATVLGCTGFSFAYGAESFPSTPIRLIVGYSAGGTADVVARALAQEVSRSLEQPVVVENKAGANALIATNDILRAKPDGHTLLMASLSHVVNPILNPAQAAYDLVQDFSPISRVGVLPLVLTTGYESRFSSLADLIREARAHPGTVSYGSAGVGGSGHLAGAMLEQETGTTMLHAPFKGNAPALMEVIAERLSFMFYPTIGIAQQIEDKKIKVLGVANKQRLDQFPDVPTLEESGFPGFENTAIWLGVLAPKGTPDTIVERLHLEFSKALSVPALRARLQDMGVQPVVDTPREFEEFLNEDHDRWSGVVEKAGLIPQ